MKNGHGFKIDKGVPIPPPQRNRKGYAVAIRLLKVGDSVVLPIKTSQAAYMAVIQIWGQFSVRTRKEGEGYRVWRIK